MSQQPHTASGHHGPDHHHHDHGADARRAGERHKGRLWLAFGLVVAYFIVQVVTGIATGSLALLSDAGHMATDALGLGMALTAITLASKGSTASHRTFGWYRLEILAALANAGLLFGVAGWVLIEAVRRLGEPPHIDGPAVLVVGALGLAVNLTAFALLRAGSKESLNVEGAYLEVVADLLGSVAVVVGAGLIWATGWSVVDPLLGAAIGLFILPRAWRLGRRALRVLTQAAPDGIEPEGVRIDLSRIEGVVDVHDVHLWTLTSGMEVATAHVVVTPGTDTHRVLDQARTVLESRHQIRHATIQIEPSDHTGCDEVGW